MIWKVAMMIVFVMPAVASLIRVTAWLVDAPWTEDAAWASIVAGGCAAYVAGAAVTFWDDRK